MEDVREAPDRVHLGRLLKGHEDRWVALSDDLTRVLAEANTLAEAVASAEALGHESPIVIWAPPTLEGLQL